MNPKSEANKLLTTKRPAKSLSSLFTLSLCLVSASAVQANLFDKIRKKIDNAEETANDVNQLQKEIQNAFENKPQSPNKPKQTPHQPQPQNSQSQATPSAQNTTAKQNGASSQSGSIPEDNSRFWQSPENHREWPAYYEMLDMEMGEYKVYQPTDPSQFATLYVPSYKGLPRVGPELSYDRSNPDYANHGRHRYKAKSIASLFNKDSISYFNLVALHLLAEHWTPEFLKLDRSGTPDNGFKNPRDLYMYDGYYTPRTHMESLAASLLLPEAYQSYYCDTCEYESKQMNRNGAKWGSGNEFSARSSFYKFVDIESPKLVEWASELEREVYIVSQIHPLPYDFSRKGLVLQLQSPKTYGTFRYTPRDPANAYLTYHDPNSGYRESEIFLEASPEVVEQYIQPTTKLFYAIKGEIYGADRVAGRFPKLPCTLQIDTTSSIVEIFTDSLLLNKIGEIDLETTRTLKLGSNRQKEATAETTQSQAQPNSETAPIPSTVRYDANENKRLTTIAGIENLLVYDSPDKTTLKPIILGTFKGIPTFGLPALNPRTNQAYEYSLSPSDRNVYRILTTDVRNSLKMYKLLLDMNYGKESYDANWLKENYKGLNSFPKYGSDPRQSWFRIVDDLAGNFLTLDGFKKYMASPEDNMPNRNFGNYATSITWGGMRADQFKKQRAFAEFIDNEMPKFFAWAATLSPEDEFYMIGNSRVSPYLFQEEGFIVDISPVSSPLGRLPDHSTYSAFERKGYGRTGAGKLVKVAMDEAEAITERVQRQQIYIAYRAKHAFDGEASYISGTYNINPQNIRFTQQIESADVEVYVGHDLSELLFRVPLN